MPWILFLAAMLAVSPVYADTVSEARTALEALVVERQALIAERDALQAKQQNAETATTAAEAEIARLKSEINRLADELEALTQPPAPVPAPPPTSETPAPIQEAQLRTPGVLPAGDAALAQCDYYASPTGSSLNDGKTALVPFRIQDFWAVAAPGGIGKTLCLRNGTYQGSDHMIDPPSGLSGTSGSPITVRALNDGQAMIDGQFARTPALLNDVDWWVLEGFNAKNGSGGVVTVSTNSNSVILRRIVAWDANATKNRHIIFIGGGATNTLLEDVAAFGTGNNPISIGSGSAPSTIVRRAWTRFEGTVTIATVRSMRPAYHTGNYAGSILENVLSTWWAGSMPESGEYTDGSGVPTGQTFSNFKPKEPRSVFGTQGDQNMQQSWLGSLVYLRASDWISNQSDPALVGVVEVWRGSGLTLKDFFAIVPPTYPNAAGVKGFQLGRDGGTGNTADKITSVNSSTGSFAPDSFSAGWTVTNLSQGTTIGSVSDPWTTTTTGANLCNRYVNGVRTNEPLWSWPMNERIKAATAAAGAYSGPCPVCTGGRFTRPVADVTLDVEALLGPIPAVCRKP